MRNKPTRSSVKSALFVGLGILVLLVFLSGAASLYEASESGKAAEQAEAQVEQKKKEQAEEAVEAEKQERAKMHQRCINDGNDLLTKNISEIPSYVQGIERQQIITNMTQLVDSFKSDCDRRYK